MKSRQFFDQFNYGRDRYTGKYMGCLDCGGVNHPYMLKNKIWRMIVDFEETLVNIPLFICLFCAEKRLGRPLQDGDFMDAPINYGCFGFHKDMWTKGIK